MHTIALLAVQVHSLASVLDGSPTPPGKCRRSNANGGYYRDQSGTDQHRTMGSRTDRGLYHARVCLAGVAIYADP